MLLNFLIKQINFFLLNAFLLSSVCKMPWCAIEIGAGGSRKHEVGSILKWPWAVVITSVSEVTRYSVPPFHGSVYLLYRTGLSFPFNTTLPVIFFPIMPSYFSCPTLNSRLSERPSLASPSKTLHCQQLTQVICARYCLIRPINPTLKRIKSWKPAWAKYWKVTGLGLCSEYLKNK